LKKTLALKAVVLRDGRLYEIEAPDVVPGDILQIEEVSTWRPAIIIPVFLTRSL
jgi:magnesium-transporting ATPase (P-type)